MATVNPLFIFNWSKLFELCLNYLCDSFILVQIIMLRFLWANRPKWALWLCLKTVVCFSTDESCTFCIMMFVHAYIHFDISKNITLHYCVGGSPEFCPIGKKIIFNNTGNRQMPHVWNICLATLHREGCDNGFRLCEASFFYGTFWGAVRVPLLVGGLVFSQGNKITATVSLHVLVAC